MPAQISVAVKRVVVSNYLDGMGRNENYRKARRIRRSLSASSINTVVSEFKVVVNRVGIEAAAEEYGVTELVTQLREIAEFRRESKVELAEMLEGGRLAQKLRDHSVDAGKFDQFIDSVFKRAEKNQYTGAMVSWCFSARTRHAPPPSVSPTSSG